MEWKRVMKEGRKQEKREESDKGRKYEREKKMQIKKGRKKMNNE